MALDRQILRNPIYRGCTLKTRNERKAQVFVVRLGKHGIDVPGRGADLGQQALGGRPKSLQDILVLLRPPPTGIDPNQYYSGRRCRWRVLYCHWQRRHYQ